MGWKDEEFPQRNRIYKKYQVDILELQNIIPEIKDSLDRSNRLIPEERGLVKLITGQ